MGPKYSSMLAVSLDREEIEEGKKNHESQSGQGILHKHLEKAKEMNRCYFDCCRDYDASQIAAEKVVRSKVLQHPKINQLLVPTVYRIRI